MPNTRHESVASAADNGIQTARPLAFVNHDVSPDGLAELSAGLASGDDAAWARFHAEHGGWIFRRLLSHARGDLDLAREALQLAYLRIARHARTTRSAAEFAVWLRLVARSALSDARRRRRGFWSFLQRHAEGAEVPVVEAENADDEFLSRALDRALARLPTPERHLLTEKYLQGRNLSSLAHTLALTPKALESRLSRARARLREIVLEELTHEKSNS